MNYLLDTNHWSHLQRHHSAVIHRIQQLPPDATICMSVISKAELLVGVELTAEGNRKDELRRLYQQAIGEATEIIPVSSAVADRFAAIFLDLRRKGRPIDTNDIWIAATAMTHDLTVVTNDAHFQLIAGLRIEDWSQ